MIKFPDRLCVPHTALAEWREKSPSLPAFEPVCVGDSYEEYIHARIFKGEMDALRAHQAKRDAEVREECAQIAAGMKITNPVNGGSKEVDGFNEACMAIAYDIRARKEKL